MRVLLLLLLLLLLLSAPAAAQEPPDKPTATKKREGKEKFYDFDELLVTGELRAPNAWFTSARERLRWNRLLRLKKSFLPVLFSTDKYPTLRPK